MKKAAFRGGLLIFVQQPSVELDQFVNSVSRQRQAAQDGEPQAEYEYRKC